MSKACVCYLGIMPLKLQDSISTELRDLWEKGEKENIDFYEPYYERVVHYQSQIKDGLIAADVSNIQWLEDLRKEHYEPFIDYLHPENDYLMAFSSPITFDVFLPINNRKYAFMVRYITNITTHFHVLYNGVVFLAYADIENSTEEIRMLGPEIRECLLRCFTSSIWTPVGIPPCPIRISFYMVSQDEFKTDSLELKYYNAAIDSYVYKDDAERISYIIGFFYQNSMWVSKFASLMSLKSSLEQCVWDIQDLYSEACQQYHTMIANKRYNKSILQKLDELVFVLYEKLYAYDKENYDFVFHKQMFNDSILDSEIPEYLMKYFISEYDYQLFPQDNIKNSIVQINNAISHQKTNHYVILAAIVGAGVAIIGNLIVALFK